MMYWIVDVFSKDVFSGNSSSVIIHEKADEILYQKLAHEFFQSESIFIDTCSPQEGHFKIRCFSPYYESSVAGYSLFSAAHVLWFEQGVDVKKPIYLENNSQIYKLEYSDNFIHGSFQKRHVVPASAPDRLFNALGVLPVSVYESGDSLIVELHEEEELHSIVPDFSKLSTMDFDRIILTCERQDGKYDYVARVFAPKIGHDEESPNIHAHICLAAFWSEQLDKQNLKGFQTGYREGDVRLRVEEQFVRVSVQTVTAACGEIKLKKNK